MREGWEEVTAKVREGGRIDVDRGALNTQWHTNDNWSSGFSDLMLKIRKTEGAERRIFEGLHAVAVIDRGAHLYQTVQGIGEKGRRGEKDEDEEEKEKS